ncbi:Peptidase C39 family protein [Singulisphaera sp. GP187]|uniref:cysteine peptidase family C39 domain-containing protein n=1 Tax=Singulisphaera sp. GP187 TaxID=1882752 RepID=UPI00092B640A|nr:cysteine peptidase family C39 domain-containing protein [Singulisphaera sp. GP187]SIO07656.1 Peptidase C39 family protein [Singulisphaera sp. GP187]
MPLLKHLKQTQIRLNSRLSKFADATCVHLIDLSVLRKLTRACMAVVTITLVFFTRPVFSQHGAPFRDAQGHIRNQKFDDDPDVREQLGKPMAYNPDPKIITPDYLRLEKPLQEAVRCGPNALYVLLRTYSIHALYSKVLSACRLTEKGTTMETLSSTANRFGLKCSIRQMTPEQLSTLTVPVIVHMYRLPDRPGGADDHFTVFFGKADDSYRVIDTRDGTEIAIPKGSFVRSFSGYCLVPDSPTSINSFFVCSVVALLLITWANIYFISKAR